MTDATSLTIIKWATGALGALVASVMGFWSDLGNLLPWLGLVILIDIVSGLTAAVVSGQVDSRIAWKGMARKVYELLLVITSQIIEVVYRELVGPTPFDFSNFAAAFFILVEVISILENAGRAGLPLPPWLKGVLSILNGKVNPSGGAP